MEIGELLRSVRESNNFTLDEIQEKTKIQKRYLMAIESNNLDALPGRFYARAFIKEYAQVLGLDVSEILRQFDIEHADAKKLETVQYSRVRRARKMQTAKTSPILSFLPSFIVILLVLAILFVGWKLYQQKLLNNDKEPEIESPNDDIIIKPKPTPSEPDTPEENGDEPEDVEDEPVVEEPPAFEPNFEVLEVGQGVKPLSTVQFNHADEKLEISFEATGRTWIDLWKDETTNANHIVGQNLDKEMEKLVYDISGAEKVYLNIGFTPNLIIKINDVELEYPTDSGTHQKIWIHFNKQQNN